MIKLNNKLRTKPKDSIQLEQKYKDLTKELRKFQRKEIYFKEMREVTRMESLAKAKNKNAFWRYTKKLKNKRTQVK